MTTKTRYFLVGGTAVLVLGLAGGLIAYYGGVPALGALSQEPLELLYVPEDATVVAYADVRQVMASELRQQLLKILPGPTNVAELDGRRTFEKHTGIDVERDIDHVVAYLSPADGQGAHDHGLVLARGRFDKARIERLFEEHGGKPETYRGKQFVVSRFEHSAIPNPQPPTPNSQSLTPNLQPPAPPEIAVGFLQPDLVAIGTSAALHRAIDLETGAGVDITRNDDFMRLVRDNDDGNAWAVGKFDRLVGRARLPQAIESRLPPITYFAASGQINGGVSARLRAIARDQQSAQELHDVIRGFVALAKLQAGSRPEVQTVLQSIQLQADGTTVAMAITLPANVLQALMPHSQRSPQ